MDRDELRMLLAGEEEADGPAAVVAWPAVALVAAVLSLGTLLGGGIVLSQQGLGALERGCDGGLGVGLLLVALSGALLGLVRIVVDRRFAHEVHVDPVRLAVLAPVPLLGLALAAPGFLGCSWAAGIGDWGALGDALLGRPGLVIAAASAYALGLVLTASVRTQVPVATILAEFERLQDAGEEGPMSVDEIAERSLSGSPSAPPPAPPVPLDDDDV